jgi:hypothetical protein
MPNETVVRLLIAGLCGFVQTANGAATGAPSELTEMRATLRDGTVVVIRDAPCTTVELSGKEHRYGNQSATINDGGKYSFACWSHQVGSTTLSVTPIDGGATVSVPVEDFRLYFDKLTPLK